MRIFVFLCVMLIASSPAVGREGRFLGRAVDISSLVTKQELEEIALVIPKNLDCIVRKEPVRCGIKYFYVKDRPRVWLRDVFRLDNMETVGIGGRGSIHISFYPLKGSEIGGSVSFVKEDGDWVVDLVTVMLP